MMGRASQLPDWFTAQYFAPVPRLVILGRKVMDVLPKRFAKYGLTLHPEKTRLLEFGRCAMGKAKRAGSKT
jgi:hypothetical protein